MIDLAQADRTLRFTPSSKPLETPKFDAASKAIRDMTDEQFQAWLHTSA